MPTGMFAAGAGIALTTRFPDLPDARLLLLALPLVLPLFVSPARLPRACACLLLGIGWGCWRGGLLVAAQLPPALEGRELAATACILDLPERRVDARGESWRFRADIELLAPVPGWHGGRVDLSWYGPAALRPGQQWALRLRLRQPRGLVNPGGRDHQAWMLGEGLSASGYVVDAAPRRQLDGGCMAPVAALRFALRERLLARFGDEPRVGMLLANALGDGSLITPPQWQVLAATGTTHLMVISGLHISLVAMLVYRGARRLARLRSGLVARCPAALLAAAIALPAAFAYALLAGLSVPTQRALVMVAAAMLHLLWSRAASAWGALALAWVAVLAWQPLAATQPGFWLSFLAVAALLYGCGGRIGRLPWIELAWRPQVVVWLALLVPLLLAGIGVVALAPLVNIVAVPVVNLVVVPGALLGSAAMAFDDTVAGVINLGVLRVLDALWWLLAAAARHSVTLDGIAASGEPWHIALAATGVAWLLAPRGFPARGLGLLLLLPLLRPPQGGEQLQVTVLDVGQGSALVVRTAADVLVFDAGPRFSERFDAGRHVVVPALRQAGVTAIDHLVLSHADNDHAGGAAGVLEAMPVRRISGGQPVPGIALRPCRRGERWRSGAVVFEFLHPPAAYAGSDNDRSCVLRIAAAGVTVLVAGDIEAAAERALLRSQGEALRADVLIAPHHGSKTSSGADFVAAVAPRYVIYSSGYRNRFGHPHPTVVARYDRLGSIALDTAHAGAIRFGVDAAGRWQPPRCWREVARRYWFTPARSHTCTPASTANP